MVYLLLCLELLANFLLGQVDLVLETALGLLLLVVGHVIVGFLILKEENNG